LSRGCSGAASAAPKAGLTRLPVRGKTPMPPIITFVIPGEDTTTVPRGATALTTQPDSRRGTVKQSVRVGAQRGGQTVRVPAEPGRDVVVLRLSGGPELILHPEHARDLLLAQTTAKRTRSAAGEQGGPDEVVVSPDLSWQGLEETTASRGDVSKKLGGALLSAVEVVTDLFKDEFIDHAADFAASAVVAGVDGQVNEGVYRLHADALRPLKAGGKKLEVIPTAVGNAPNLVLIHGTFSSTAGTFRKLWSEHPERVKTLFNQYGNRVYALDHRTLAASPIENALSLASALPAGARLHLLTHSRGGLVAEVLARACADPDGALAAFGGKNTDRDRDALEALVKRVKANGTQVDRIVRVACPSRGTLLASKRLDAYLSVFKWTLELAGLPVVGEIVDFLNAVAQRGTDPEEVPGLAAQIPGSALIDWIHTTDAPIKGDLRVVAGDIQGDSLTGWVKTLLSDAFFWTDNDFIVQTRSMYGGTPRQQKAQFVLHQAGALSHFNYFKNERTANAIVDALVQELPRDFRTIGPLSWAGDSPTGVRAVIGTRTPPSETERRSKPAVILLPGILGSNLKLNGDRIWLSWRLINGLDQLGYETARPDGVLPDGPIGSSYDDLIRFLSDGHDVIEFAFDWRKPIEELGRQLGDRVAAALDERANEKLPVRILAHSMGGLVARAMLLEAPATWNRMMSRDGARLLMLGTPNGGSWAPMQVLSGDDSLGNVIATVGAPFRSSEARGVMSGFPGFLQLQASLGEAALGLGTTAKWKALADADFDRAKAASWWHRLGLQLEALRWGVPTQATLDAAVKLRSRLDAQRDNELGPFKDKLLLVVGHSQTTPSGYEEGAEGFVYLDAVDAGDGRVLHRHALLPGVRTWQVNCDHGSLSSRKEAFTAYRELLEQGTTNLLEQFSEQTRLRGAGTPSTAVLVRSRPSRVVRAVPPPEREDAVLAPAAIAANEAGLPARRLLRVTITNGDLTFVAEPLMLGHYRSTRLTGTEWVMNRIIGDVMEAAIDRGLYPDAPGTHQVFVNTRTDPERPDQPPRPEAVIVVGLGQESKLRAPDLVNTVRQAVIAWSQRLMERRPRPTEFDLATTLIGSGGCGISAGQAALLVAQGVRDANALLDDGKGVEGAWPRVRHLRLVELYLDRATEAWRALRLHAEASSGEFVVTPEIEEGTGWLRRPLDSGYRGADYDFISATTRPAAEGGSEISYTLDTKRARAEVRGQATQGALLRELVATASNENNIDDKVGRTLFQLLVPLELEPFLKGTTEMQIELDDGTAGVPWELLDVESSSPGEESRQPWAIRTKLIRKLRTETFRTQVVDADVDASALVIGEPACDDGYPPLPNARAEARAVAGCLAGPTGLAGNQVISLVGEAGQPGPNARTVINTVMDRPWRIIHIAGHGAPPEMLGPAPLKEGDPPQRMGAPRGVVLSNKAFLGAREIQNMRTVPELVFVNCCYLAATDVSQVLKGDLPGVKRYDRTHFASTVARGLIDIGVRCVIAAGWAVEDRVAAIFAKTFYAALLEGDRFIDAVARARIAARNARGNTWAAYQCYGDPDWVLRRSGADAQKPQQRPVADEFAGVASPRGLCLALHTLQVRSEYQHAAADEQHVKIVHLESRFAEKWGKRGDVAEAFGTAWLAAGDLGQAVGWLKRAVEATDGTAAIRAIEQWANVTARLALQTAERLGDGTDTSSPLVDRDLEEPIARIDEALARLNQLIAIKPTAERESLLASTYKRKALVARMANEAQAESDAVKAMRHHYEEAASLSEESGGKDYFYPAMNVLAADLVLHAGKTDWTGFDASFLGKLRSRLSAQVAAAPDFWTIANQIELRLYEALARGDLNRERRAIERQYDDLYRRISARRMWQSVYDQAIFVLGAYRKLRTAERESADTLLDSLAVMADVARVPGERPDVGSQVFIAAAADDQALVNQLTGELTRHGVTVNAAEESIEDVRACIVVVSKASREPTPELSHEWNRILERRRNDASFMLFVLVRHANAARPPILADAAPVCELPKGARAAARTVATALHRSSVESRL
jgi:pimeloyl-ACP methyl ester carboxylesterase/tetratricopeptide (TPR) repeat protein